MAKYTERGTETGKHVFIRLDPVAAVMSLTHVAACIHLGDGRPQLLRPQAFNQLCELLSDRLVGILLSSHRRIFTHALTLWPMLKLSHFKVANAS